MLIDSNVPRQPEFSGKIKKLIETIDRLYRRDAKGPLRRVLAKVHPVDLALVLRNLPDEHVAPIFDTIPEKEIAGETFTEVSPRVRDIILEEIPTENLVPILEELPPDELTDLIQALEPEVADRLTSAMQRESIDELENLLVYEPETAGGIMTTDFFSLQDDVSVKDAIEAIHGEEDVETIYYLYVTSPEGELVGVVSLRQFAARKAGNAASGCHEHPYRQGEYR